MLRFPARAARRALASAFIVTATILPGVFPRPAAATESLGSVTIVQATPANPAQAFNYTSNVPEMLTGFSLDQDPTTWPAPWETSNYVTPGQFEVSQEEPPVGWRLESIECTDPQGESSSGDAGSRTATIRMDGDEEIVCTFTNVPAVGDILVHQSTIPQDPVVFQFGGDIGAFALADDGDEVGDGTWRDYGTSGLTAGTYQLTQQPMTGWNLTGIDCSDPDNGTTVNLVEGTVTFDLDADETIDCTFTNQSGAVTTGDINIDLQAVPEGPVDVGFSGDLGSFALDDDGDTDDTLPSGMSFPLLSPGTKIVDIEPPEGWLVTDRVCVDPDGGTTVDVQRFTIDLDAGETVNCAVQVEPAPPPPLPNQVNITLDAVPNDPVDVPFTFGEVLAFTLDDDADGALSNGQEYNDMEIESWPVTASVPAGWRIKDIACTDPDGGSTVDKTAARAIVDLDDGETVNCTFTIEPIPQTPPPAPAPTCNGLVATIVGRPGATTIRGTAGNDVIVDLDGGNRIDGRGGNDVICTGNADDAINGGTGDDWILAGAGRNNVDGGAGSDVVAAGGGDDTVAGGAGNDELYVGEGDNSVSGGAGDDFIQAGDGNDRIDGGKNYDTCLPGLGTNTVRNCEA